MEKKKVLIIHPSMEIGGAERALLGLLDSLDYGRYEVDLLLCGHHGDFLPLVNGGVRLLPYDKRYDFFQSPVSALVKDGQWGKAALRVLAKWRERWRSRKMGKKHSVWHAQQHIHRLISPLVPDVEGEYDLAINFLGIPSILTDHVKAKVKVAWVHTDYSKIVADAEIDRYYWSRVDWIVNVSEDCKRVFDSFYPEFVEKSIIIENILNTRLTKNLATESAEIPFNNEYINLLTIGRFSPPKKMEEIPEISRMMIDGGVKNFKWYLIGYGSGEDEIRENINKFDVDDNVIILGKRVNPYPYIASCDIYLQPSRFEGKAVTVREAQMLGKPVIVTDYATAPSQITNGIDGLILPMNKEDFAHRLASVLNDPGVCVKLSDFCRAHDFGNEAEVEKIYGLIRE